MKSVNDMIRRGFKISFLCFLLTLVIMPLSAYAKTSNNRARDVRTPDFAFPKTVDKNASASFDKAMKSRNWCEVLVSAIQLDIAGYLVSQDSFRTSAERFDTIAKVMPSPWSNLALILEARMYSDYYSQNSWKFDRRTLPESDIPADVNEWNAAMFRDKVMTLSSEALKNGDNACCVPVSEIKGVLTDYEQADKDGFSVLDFITLQTINVLSPFVGSYKAEIIPFGPLQTYNKDNSISGFITDLIDGSIKRNEQLNNEYILAFFRELKLQKSHGEEKTALASHYYDIYKDSPLGAPFVAGYYLSKPVIGDDIKEKNRINRENYDILVEYQKKFPKARSITTVESILYGMEEKQMNVTFPDRMLANRVDSVRVSGSNIYDFYILIYSLPFLSTNDANYDYGMIKRNGRLLDAVHVTIDGTTPDFFNKMVAVGNLKPGYYAFIPSLNKHLSGNIGSKDNYSVSVANVSNIDVICSSGNRSLEKDFFVVSALDNKPIEGAVIKLSEMNDKRQVIKTSVIKSDSDGKFSLKHGNYSYIVEYGNNRLSGYLYDLWKRNAEEKESEIKAVPRGRLLTDLAVYHPGDTVRFAAVIWNEESGKRLYSADNRQIEIRLHNANYEQVDSCSLTTDSFGRCDGSFILPATGLLGTWNIGIYDGKNQIGNAVIEIAEYKQPSFFVTVSQAKSNDSSGETVSFDGNVLTYSGMPVAGAKVNYKISFMPFWRSWGYDDAQYVGTTTTDSEGIFNIRLNTEGLRDTRFERGTFCLTSEVTDSAGETQMSAPTRFILGNAYKIQTDIPDKINADVKNLSFDVKVIDAVYLPVAKTVDYEILSGDDIVEQGSFESPVFNLSVNSLKSGRYDFRFRCENDTVEKSIVLWRSSDKEPAVKSLVWVDSLKIISPQNAKAVKLRVGSSYPDNYILAQICNSKEIIEYRWLNVNCGFINMEVPAPAGDEQIFVNLLGLNELNYDSATVRIIPSIQTEALNITVESFRENISPGDMESWRFSFSFDNHKQPSLPVIAVMTDKAVNSLASNIWSFNPYGSLYWSSASGLVFESSRKIRNWLRVNSNNMYTETDFFVLPDFQLYGYSLIGNFNNRRLYKMARAATSNSAMSGSSDMVMIEDASAPLMAMAEERGVESESSFDTAAVTSGAGVTVENESEGETADFRNTDLAVALFKPNLTTDSLGNVTVDFVAPDFVGSWMFEILGYTPDMRGSALCLDAVSSKKIMVQLNAPRFVRTGDLLSVAATLFNNTSSEKSVTGKIEFVNPLTGETLYSYSPSSKILGPSKSDVVTAQMRIPMALETLAIRVYGEIPGYRDGEQIIIPVLPSSQPVTDSQPFYISAGENNLELKLPEFNKDAKVTLTYCDNPVWECVTALPSLLKPESVNILAQVRALYGNCVTSGLFIKYPELAEGIKRMSMNNVSDSLLFSPLQRNRQLKTVMLNNTPWVNDAQSETVRMENLVKYTDPEYARQTIDDILMTLKERRNNDGGWGWCPQMQSSSYITIGVFSAMARLENIGYLPNQARILARDAASYLDNILAEDWNRSKRKSFLVDLLLDYLYAKSAFKNIPSTSSFKPLESVAIAEIEKDWRKFDISHKATAAILLERKGNFKTSRLILESLRQYASESPEKGMWFDNLESGYYGMNSIMTTARVLEAFALIEPSNPAVDKIRQWLVISKQTQNWGDDLISAAAVNAILTSGSVWTNTDSAPEVSINGKSIDIDRISQVEGSFIINLKPDESSGSVLTISRSGSGPAWGGVTAQYIAPISEVKAASVPQLSVRKNFYVLTSDNQVKSPENDNFTVGDKIRVSLILNCDRDIEYVAVTDPRPACFEPAEQLSGYTSADGVWFYKEIRNTSTNLFIPFLPKGTHVITYDCFADRYGEYASGVVSAQSQYAPSIICHSGGAEIRVKD